MPDSVEYERWLKAQAAREAKKKLDAKRASNVESKLAGAPVQMKWHMKSPAYFHKELTAKYAGVPTYTEEQQDALGQAAIRREFVLEARRVYRLMDKDKSRGLEHEELRDLTGSPMAAEYLLELWDADGDGKVQMHEWMNFVTPLYDENPDGAEFLLDNVKVSLARRAFETDTRRIFELADLDGSGHLDFHEVMELCSDEHGGVSFASFEIFYEGMDQNKDFEVIKCRRNETRNPPPATRSQPSSPSLALLDHRTSAPSLLSHLA